MQFIGVAGRDELDAIRAFIDDLDVDGFPHVVDESGEIWVTYEVTTQPSFAFLNDDGTGEVFVGAMGVEGLTEQVEELQAR